MTIRGRSESFDDWNLEAEILTSGPPLDPNAPGLNRIEVRSPLIYHGCLEDIITFMSLFFSVCKLGYALLCLCVKCLRCPDFDLRLRRPVCARERSKSGNPMGNTVKSPCDDMSTRLGRSKSQLRVIIILGDIVELLVSSHFTLVNSYNNRRY